MAGDIAGDSGGTKRQLPSSVATPGSPFAVDDLERKLKSVLASTAGPENQEPHRSGTKSSRRPSTKNLDPVNVTTPNEGNDQGGG